MPRVKKSSAKKGQTQQTIVNKVVQIMEKKKQDKFYEFYSAYGQSVTWVFNDLTGAIAQGTTVSQRVGMSIRLTHVKCRITATIGDSTNVMRFILFRWKVSDTSDAPDAAEMFTTNGLGSNPVNAPILPVKPSRFQIVKDHVFTMATNWKPVQTFVFDLPVKWAVEYDIGVNTGKDHLYLATCSDSGGVPNPSWIHEFVIHYHDTE
jgi:hypothetical protein